MPRRWFLPVSCLLLPLAAGGCILPIPHAKQTAGPISGELIDPGTQQPVARARIVAAYGDGGQAQTTSDAEGRFSFPSKRRWHWGVLLGLNQDARPESLSLPLDWGWAGVDEVRIIAPGRETLVLVPRPPGEPAGPKEPGGSDSPGDSGPRRGLLPSRGLLDFLSTESTDPIVLGRVAVPAAGDRKADSSSAGPAEETNRVQPDRQEGQVDGQTDTD